MQIVTDTGMDLHLPPDESPEIEIHIVRHSITLDGKTYFSGLDIEPEELQKMLMATSSFPTTSQPSAGDFAAMYKKLAATDPDILSINMSSGLSGTVNAARTTLMPAASSPSVFKSVFNDRSARISATPPPATTPSSTAARVA